MIRSFGLARPLWPLAVGAFVGTLGLLLLFSGRETRFEEAGLGFNTTAVYLDHALGKIHCASAGEPCLAAQAARKLDRRFVWLGASHLHGVNEMQDGQKTAPWLVFDVLRNTGTDVATISIPNGNPKEFYVLLEHIVARQQIDGLLLGLVYDDMREDGLRAGLSEIASQTEVAARLSATEIGRSILREAGQQTAATPGQPTNGQRQTWQDSSEVWLTGALETCCGFETLRAQARGQIILSARDLQRAFSALRNRYSRDLSQYQVVIPETRYRENFAALRALLATAAAADISVLLYVVPRPTDFFPYDPSGYETFKSSTAALAEQNGAHFVNLEDALPNELWGLVDLTFGAPFRDPFHFKAAGHARLADALLAEIRRSGLGETQR